MNTSSEQLIKTMNWAGNKTKNILEINGKINLSKNYENVVDGFLGSGTLLLNLRANGKKYIGYDIMELPSKFLNSIYENKEEITFNDFEILINKYNNFSDKKYYFEFRSDWNQINKNSKNKKEFIISTVILLKLCSNSIVRFNKKGEFNQGFRGLGKLKKEKGIFFKDKVLQKIFKDYQKLENTLKNGKYVFEKKDFLTELKKYGEGDLLILDPPYKNVENIYDIKNKWSNDKESELLDFLKNEYKGDFIYFGYINKEKKSQAKKDKNSNIVKFINTYGELNILEMKNHISMGQKRKGLANIKEVVITNLLEPK